MAQIVAAYGLTHAAVMVRTWERAPEAVRDEVDAGYRRIAQGLRDARPDLIVLVGNDHFQSFFLDNMPPFCLGIGSHSQGWGEADIPPYELTVPGKLAEALLEGLLARGFDIAYARNLPLDHAFMVPVHLLMPQADIPVIPLFQNCVAPPLPSLGRCLALGTALADTLAGLPANLRVALLGTGGLSHEIPLPDWRELGDDRAGRDWLTFMSQGRHRADPATQQAIADEVLRWGRSGGGRTDEAFDREVLALLEAGDYPALASYDTATIRQRAGNGAQELRNWATVAGACQGHRGETLFYRDVPEWLTGVAGVDLMAKPLVLSPS